MAELVQQVMERMIPELEDLQARGLFSSGEIRSIVSKRRNFEYLLKSRAPKKADFLRAIAYELNLDALRRRRKQRLATHKTTLSDFGCTRRIHFIFVRALRKFASDVQLWLQYVEYCVRSKSSKTLGRVFPRALQLHPHNEVLWLQAAAWEFESNTNVSSSRVLMQRALRMNKESTRLWLEYFRMELLFIGKLQGRRQLLGLSEEDMGRPVKSPEKQAKALAKGRKPRVSSDAKSAFFSGAIPIIVFRNAIEAVPADLSFRLQFLSVIDLFLARHSELRHATTASAGDGDNSDAADQQEIEENERLALQPVADAIVSSLTRDFPRDARAWNTCALREMAALLRLEANTARAALQARREHRRKRRRLGDAVADGDGSDAAAADAAVDVAVVDKAERATMAVFEKAVKALPTVHMWLHYARFLAQRLEAAAAKSTSALDARVCVLSEDLCSVLERSHKSCPGEAAAGSASDSDASNSASEESGESESESDSGNDSGSDSDGSSDGSDGDESTKDAPPSDVPAAAASSASGVVAARTDPRAAAAAAALAREKAWVEIYHRWVEVLLRRGKLVEAQAAAMAGTRRIPQCARLWLLATELRARADGVAALEGTLESSAASPLGGVPLSAELRTMLEEALAAVPADESLPLWLRLLDLTILDSPTNSKTILPLFQRALRRCPLGTSCLVHRMVDWSFVHHAPGGHRAVRDVYARLVRSGVPARLPLSFYRQCILVESTARGSIGSGDVDGSVSHSRKLFEAALLSADAEARNSVVAADSKLRGVSSTVGELSKLWLEYCALEQQEGDARSTNAVYWRAVRAVRDSDAFTTAFNAQQQLQVGL